MPISPLHQFYRLLSQKMVWQNNDSDASYPDKTRLSISIFGKEITKQTQVFDEQGKLKETKEEILNISPKKFLKGISKEVDLDIDNYQYFMMLSDLDGDQILTQAEIEQASIITQFSNEELLTIQRKVVPLVEDAKADKKLFAFISGIRALKDSSLNACSNEELARLYGAICNLHNDFHRHVEYVQEEGVWKWRSAPRAVGESGLSHADMRKALDLVQGRLSSEYRQKPWQG